MAWIEQRQLTSDDDLRHFAAFSALLVAKNRDVGAAGVLAYAKANRATAIIDDGPARRAAQRYDVACRGTLALLCEGYFKGFIAVSGYRLPFGPCGFERWARDNNLIAGDDQWRLAAE